jgi:hypothetical protein
MDQLKSNTMKTLKLFAAICVIALATFSTPGIAQTRQFDLTMNFDIAPFSCLERECHGWLIYHISYHLDQAGKVDWIHWNVKHAELIDAETHERYIYKDTGHDKLGLFWDWFNNVASIDEPYGIIVNVEDGWLPLPEGLPDEGSMIWSTIKWISKGGVVASMTSIYQVHQNANGELVVEHYTDRLDCN